jgi:putative FmdB family regulatory protein
MPLYEYVCEACQKRFEVIRKFSDPELEVCTLCGKGPVQRQMSSPAIQFKGSGWYITDYSQKGKSSSESGKSDSESTSKSSTTDSKPATGDSTSSSTKTDTTTPAAKPATSD